MLEAPKISVAPVSNLPAYIIPGNIKVIPLGPAGLWNIRYYAPEAASPYSFNGQIEITQDPSSGLYKGRMILNGHWAYPTWKSLTDISFDSYNNTLKFKVPMQDGMVWMEDFTGTISGQKISGISNVRAGSVDTQFSIEGTKEPIELFIPLQTRSSVSPELTPGLTVIQSAQQILMNQGVSKQPVIASAFKPSPYIPFGSVMVVPLDTPHGLWKIRYVVGGIENQGQLEIAEVMGVLIGRMNVSGGMMYGASGWESISNIVFNKGLLGNSLSFIRDYTRQSWEGKIDGGLISGTYGGGLTKGGGIWIGEKQPIEIFIPTDITQYTEQITVTKEMPIATLIPIETVTGKPTGKVVIEEGFQPTPQESTLIAMKTSELLPSKASIELQQGGSPLISEIPSLISKMPSWVLIAIGGVALFMFMGKGSKREE
jgi:hypothetical protein